MAWGGPRSEVPPTRIYHRTGPHSFHIGSCCFKEWRNFDVLDLHSGSPQQLCRPSFLDSHDLERGPLRLGANMWGSIPKARLFDIDDRSFGCRWKVGPSRIRWITNQDDWSAVKGTVKKLCEKCFRNFGLPNGWYDPGIDKEDASLLDPSFEEMEMPRDSDTSDSTSSEDSSGADSSDAIVLSLKTPGC